MCKKNQKKGAEIMKQTNKTVEKSNPAKMWTLLACAVILTMCVIWQFGIPVHAADIWGQKRTPAEEFYREFAKIATPVAIASIAVLKIFSLFTHNPRKLAEIRELGKKIVIAYFLLVGGGYFLVKYADIF